ncbi:hypothetical protein D3C72_1453990 [compost metagenome]
MRVLGLAEDQAAAADRLPGIARPFKRGQAAWIGAHIDPDRRQVDVERLDIGQHEMARPPAGRADVERHARFLQDRIATLAGDKGVDLGRRHIRRVVQRLETGIALRQVQAADEIAKLAARDMVAGAEQRLHGHQYVGIEPDPGIDLLDHVAGIVLETQADIFFQQVSAERIDDGRGHHAKQQGARGDGARPKASKRAQRARKRLAQDCFPPDVDGNHAAERPSPTTDANSALIGWGSMRNPRSYMS